ncbi:hypothetical protein AHMF7605_02775 [Adhaeribacter arboris]|uniref:Cupin n=1 Tax=Adhaeribacter arboris TaxID=2072846 RepID=A0A2T2YAK1_9BACT|nr:hypothetical protein [Adhaeribacter arboris]PSR52523.1 hypothetical protein AHMF7605_02775 [Adhaeribacter arboris]
MNTTDILLAPMSGAEHRLVGGVQLDFMQTGAARVKRVIYPIGFRWSTDMKPIIGTDLCMHAHAGFLAKGHLRIQYEDGFTEDFIAPQVVAIEPGHDGWVVGEEPAVLIEFDFQGETVQQLQIPEVHSQRATPPAS